MWNDLKRHLTTIETLGAITWWPKKIECGELLEGVVVATTLGDTLVKLQLLCVGIDF